jgi:predicted metal-dependent HD superfamily phosphohydrolase/outer membrane protein assembly factor BamB
MELRDRWNHLLPDAKPLGQDLLGRYAEPHRAYHDRRHLTEMLDTVDELAGEAKDPDSVRLAAWFHDAVYDPKAPAGENEETSAQLAEAELAAYGLDAEQVAEVGRLVRLTASHRATEGDANGAVLCDADLRILAADRDRYDRYAADVRREYAHVPDDDFARGRAAVLERLADGPIFSTGHGHDAWERPARANLDRELAALRSGGATPWAGLVPLLYLGAALGLVVGASVLLGRAVAAAPSWPAAPGAERGFGWWAPAAGAGVAALGLAAWLLRARPRVMLALCAPLTLGGLAGVLVSRLRWPEVSTGTAMSDRWPYLLLASIATLLGGVLLAVGCRLRTVGRYAVRPPRIAGPAVVAVAAVLATWVVLTAGAPFVQARLEAANTTSDVASEPPAADAPVRLDGELAWTGVRTGAGSVTGTAGGLAQLRPDGVVTVDAATGRLRWSYRRADVTGATGPEAHGMVLSADRQTLAVHLPRGDRSAGEIDLPTYAVLDAVSGAVLSEVHTDGTALAVDRDRLIVAESNDIAAYPAGNADSWRVRSDCPVTRAELVAGTLVAIPSCAPSGPQTVHGMDASDGSERWTVDVGRRLSPDAGTAEEPTEEYRIGDLTVVPDSRRVAGLGWSPHSGGTLYEWVLDAAEGRLVWSAPVPGSPRPQPGASGCTPGLMANHASLVLIACRPAPAGSSQVYDAAAANPADGTPQWHHLLSVPPALRHPAYPRAGFALMGDGRVITMMPSAAGCLPVTIGTVGVQARPFIAGDVAVPEVGCDRPRVTVAGAGRPVLADTTHLLALR